MSTPPISDDRSKSYSSFDVGGALKPKQYSSSSSSEYDDDDVSADIKAIAPSLSTLVQNMMQQLESFENNGDDSDSTADDEIIGFDGNAKKSISTLVQNLVEQNQKLERTRIRFGIESDYSGDSLQSMVSAIEERHQSEISDEAKMDSVSSTIDGSFHVIDEDGERKIESDPSNTTMEQQQNELTITPNPRTVSKASNDVRDEGETLELSDASSFETDNSESETSGDEVSSYTSTQNQDNITAKIGDDVSGSFIEETPSSIKSSIRDRLSEHVKKFDGGPRTDQWAISAISFSSDDSPYMSDSLSSSSTSMGTYESFSDESESDDDEFQTIYDDGESSGVTSNFDNREEPGKQMDDIGSNASIEYETDADTNIEHDKSLPDDSTREENDSATLSFGKKLRNDDTSDASNSNLIGGASNMHLDRNSTDSDTESHGTSTLDLLDKDDEGTNESDSQSSSSVIGENEEGSDSDYENSFRLGVDSSFSSSSFSLSDTSSSRDELDLEKGKPLYERVESLNRREEMLEVRRQKLYRKVFAGVAFMFSLLLTLVIILAVDPR